MGIGQSVMQYQSSETDEEENVISSLYSYNLTNEKIRIGQSFVQYQSSETDEEENAISSLYSYNLTNEKMGIGQSVMQYQSSETDEEDNDVSSLYSYNLTNEKMGIGQSFVQYQSSETDEEENAISSLYSYNLTNGERLEHARRHNVPASPHKWRIGNDSALSHQMKYLTISAPKLRDSSSLANTSVNNNVCGGERIGIWPSSRGKAEEKRREEGLVVINCTVMAPEGRWIKHYSSCHRILLVGEGDFSFSTCLAAAFGSASNMIATSLDSQDFLVENYHNASSNLLELSIRKCKVMHKIDATEMADHPFLGEIKFDRIIFNFPFAGFFKDMPRDYQLRLHRRLVNQFLMNAKEMISENGEIHITHKTNGFHKEWNLESIASSHGLRLVEAVDFNLVEYPGYNTKCGFGGDNNFNCYPSKTYKFGV